MTLPRIIFDSVSFSYNAQTPALDKLSLQIEQGSWTCVLGGNGSGKSSLAKHINALLVPDEGRVFVNGFDTADENTLFDIRSTVGMVFQNPDDQMVASLIEDEIAFGPENLQLASDEIRRRVTNALEDVGMTGFERQETYALSGGQKQRIALAGALAMQPSILILDEASSMLDPRGRAGLIKLIEKLHQRGMTIVMITHFMDEAQLADRVIVLDKGRLAWDGIPAELFAQDSLLAKLHLEKPFDVQFFEALSTAGIDRHDARLADLFPLEAQSLRQTPCKVKHQAATTPSPAAATIAGPKPCNSKRIALLELAQVSYTYDEAFAKRYAKAAKKALAPRPTWGKSADEPWALKDISLQIFEGDYLGIAGHTGSGKSTLIQHLNGLITPTQGSLIAQGKPVSSASDKRELRRLCGLVFQYPEHQLFASTVYEDVCFGPANLRLSKEEQALRYTEAMNLVGLDPEALQDICPFELSGGQQRRVAFAGILAMKPSILILDEPCAGLDPQSRHEFLELINKLHTEEGLSLVMVSHHMEDLGRFCSRVVILDEGEICAQGSPEEIFSGELNLKALGLGLPQAQALKLRLEKAGIQLPRHLYTQASDVAQDLASVLSQKDHHA